MADISQATAEGWLLAAGAIAGGGMLVLSLASRVFGPVWRHRVRVFTALGSIVVALYLSRETMHAGAILGALVMSVRSLHHHVESGDHGREREAREASTDG